jgi:hypothetical protein
MACSTKVVADILNNCVRPVKGLKPKTWIFNNGDFTLTKTANVLSAIVKIGSVTAFTAEGFKDFQNAGHEAVVAENLPTAYKHKYTINANAATAAEKANIDKADNIFVVTQENDGLFWAYGITNGLWKAAQSKMANDNNNQTIIEFASREGMEEEYSAYQFTLGGTAAADLAYLVALET